METAVIVDAVRTPIGRYGGALKDIRPDDLAALAIKALLERTGIDPFSYSSATPRQARLPPLRTLPRASTAWRGQIRVPGRQCTPLLPRGRVQRSRRQCQDSCEARE